MNSNFKKFTTFFLLIISFNLFPQNNPELVTDRPDRTESASTIPADWLQIETGYEYVREASNENSDLASINAVGTLIRFGLFDEVELRLAGAFLSQELKSINNELSSDGLTNFMFGAKFGLAKDHETIPDIALLTHLFLPVGAESHRPDKVEPQAILSFSKAVLDFLDFGANFGMHYTSSDEKAFYFYTLAAGVDITEKLGGFIEIFSEVFTDTSPFYSVDTGLTYLLLSNLQLDVSAGNGLFSNSKVWYLGAGFSIRLPR
ncbi:MAG: transporter [bacterium]|nr:transporter [bacterium]